MGRAPVRPADIRVQGKAMENKPLAGGGVVTTVLLIIVLLIMSGII
jgi:hypothetical protein